MVEKEFCIINEHGLHARPASLFCDTASKFKSEIKIFHNDIRADGKSAISILILEVYPGSNIRVKIDGPDEEAAMEALTKLIDSNFNQ